MLTPDTKTEISTAIFWTQIVWISLLHRSSFPGVSLNMH